MQSDSIDGRTQSKEKMMDETARQKKCAVNDRRLLTIRYDTVDLPVLKS